MRQAFNTRRFQWKVLPAIIACMVISCGKNKTETKDSPLLQQDPIANPYYSRSDTTILSLSDSEWKAVLSDSLYLVARNKVTERAFKGKYWNFNGVGTYYCAACGNRLFRSDSKFASECGWPTFFEPSRTNSVKYIEDRSHGMVRTEVLCGRCGGHLGHLFKDGPPPSFNRYCMNSIVLDFVPELN
ncbi:MAG TPA: peptide-methionine (R)-S-oxide reductase MsrB [Cyclobacteriaceae bacterium]|nr:peptide-methionine (R)-S-oxide reductase MsrB [Cyclobacteriaceae bacterium]